MDQPQSCAPQAGPCPPSEREEDGPPPGGAQRGQEAPRCGRLKGDQGQPRGGTVKEAWQVVRKWYRQAGEVAPQPNFLTLQCQMDECVKLYWYAPSPGGNIPTNADMASVLDTTLEDEVSEKQSKRPTCLPHPSVRTSKHSMASTKSLSCQRSTWASAPGRRTGCSIGGREATLTPIVL